MATRSALDVARSALEWYAEQSWDTGDVHYGHGEKAREALAALEDVSAYKPRAELTRLLAEANLHIASITAMECEGMTASEWVSRWLDISRRLEARVDALTQGLSDD